LYQALSAGSTLQAARNDAHQPDGDILALSPIVDIDLIVTVVRTTSRRPVVRNGLQWLLPRKAAAAADMLGRL
jgi:hypothetical protein